MGYGQLTSGFANLITAMFEDTCTLTEPNLVNVDGIVAPDEDNPNALIEDVPCAFEPLSKTGQVEQLVEAGLLSIDVTHRILLPVTDATTSLKPSWVITVNTRDERPELIFDRPQRMDESLSSLLIVAAVLRNQ
jgi:hypothetical protein